MIVGIRDSVEGETIRISGVMDEKVVKEGNDPDGVIQSRLAQAGMEVNRMIEDKTVDEYYQTEANEK